MIEASVSTAGARNRKVLILAGCLVALFAGVWAAAGPIAHSNAAVATFCNGYNAAKYGQPGDRCHDSSYRSPLNGVTGKGVNHSACVDAENTGGSLVYSWVCSSGPNVEVSRGTCCSLTLRGVVRNNTTGDTNHLYGWDLY
ncbi:MAG: hypothetical protein R2725_12470 [Solirubrobacterales bacterium]